MVTPVHLNLLSLSLGLFFEMVLMPLEESLGQLFDYVCEIGVMVGMSFGRCGWFHEFVNREGYDRAMYILVSRE